MKPSWLEINRLMIASHAMDAEHRATWFNIHSPGF